MGLVGGFGFDGYELGSDYTFINAHVRGPLFFERVGFSSVLRCILCMQASESLAVPVARVQYMEDGVVMLSPPEDSHAAMDDISQE